MEKEQIEDLFSVLKWHVVPLACIFLALRGTKKFKQTQFEEFATVWFITNGAIIHIFLDGLIGCLQYCQPLFRVYSMLDNRYKQALPNVWLISFIELIFMGPVCLYVGRLYSTIKNIKRDIWTIIVSTVQLMGTICFTGEEIFRGFKDVCEPEGCYTFSYSNIVFFWIFFVVANTVWIVIPCMFICKSSCRIISYDQWQPKSSEMMQPIKEKKKQDKQNY